MSQVKEHPSYRGSRWGSMQWFRRKLGDAHMSCCWMWIGVQCTESAGSVVLIATWLSLSTSQILAALQRFLCRFSKSSEPKIWGKWQLPDQIQGSNPSQVHMETCLKKMQHHASVVFLELVGETSIDCNRLHMYKWLRNAMVSAAHRLRSA